LKSKSRVMCPGSFIVAKIYFAESYALVTKQSAKCTWEGPLTKKCKIWCKKKPENIRILLATKCPHKFSSATRTYNFFFICISYIYKNPFKNIHIYNFASQGSEGTFFLFILIWKTSTNKAKAIEK